MTALVPANWPATLETLKHKFYDNSLFVQGHIEASQLNEQEIQAFVAFCRDKRLFVCISNLGEDGSFDYEATLFEQIPTNIIGYWAKEWSAQIEGLIEQSTEASQSQFPGNANLLRLNQAHVNIALWIDPEYTPVFFPPEARKLLLETHNTNTLLKLIERCTKKYDDQDNITKIGRLIVPAPFAVLGEHLSQAHVDAISRSITNITHPEFRVAMISKILPRIINVKGAENVTPELIEKSCQAAERVLCHVEQNDRTCHSAGVPFRASNDLWFLDFFIDALGENFTPGILEPLVGQPKDIMTQLAPRLAKSTPEGLEKKQLTLSIQTMSQLDESTADIYAVSEIILALANEEEPIEKTVKNVVDFLLSLPPEFRSGVYSDCKQVLRSLTAVMNTDNLIPFEEFKNMVLEIENLIKEVNDGPSPHNFQNDLIGILAVNNRTIRLKDIQAYKKIMLTEAYERVATNSRRGRSLNCIISNTRHHMTPEIYQEYLNLARHLSVEAFEISHEAIVSLHAPGVGEWLNKKPPEKYCLDPAKYSLIVDLARRIDRQQQEIQSNTLTRTISFITGSMGCVNDHKSAQEAIKLLTEYCDFIEANIEHIRKLEDQHLVIDKNGKFKHGDWGFLTAILEAYKEKGGRSSLVA